MPPSSQGQSDRQSTTNTQPYPGPTPPSPRKITGLHAAAAGGSLPQVKCALESHQPVNALLHGVTPLHAASTSASVACVAFLLDHGADPNAATVRVTSSSSSRRNPGAEGAMPLHFAAANGHAPIVELLLQRGAHPAPVDGNGMTPQNLALRSGHLACAEAIASWKATYGTTGLAGRPPGASSMMSIEPALADGQLDAMPSSSKPRASEDGKPYLIPSSSVSTLASPMPRKQTSSDQLPIPLGSFNSKLPVAPSPLRPRTPENAKSATPTTLSSRLNDVSVSSQRRSSDTSDQGLPVPMQAAMSETDDNKEVDSVDEELGFATFTTPATPLRSGTLMSAQVSSPGASSSKRRPSLPSIIEKATQPATSMFKAALTTTPLANKTQASSTADSQASSVEPPKGTMAKLNPKKNIGSFLKKATGSLTHSRSHASLRSPEPQKSSIPSGVRRPSESSMSRQQSGDPQRTPVAGSASVMSPPEAEKAPDPPAGQALGSNPMRPATRARQLSRATPYSPSIQLQEEDEDEVPYQTMSHSRPREGSIVSDGGGVSQQLPKEAIETRRRAQSSASVTSRRFDLQNAGPLQSRSPDEQLEYLGDVPPLSEVDAGGEQMDGHLLPANLRSQRARGSPRSGGSMTLPDNPRSHSFSSTGSQAHPSILLRSQCSTSSLLSASSHASSSQNDTPGGSSSGRGGASGSKPGLLLPRKSSTGFAEDVRIMAAQKAVASRDRSNSGASSLVSRPSFSSLSGKTNAPSVAEQQRAILQNAETFSQEGGIAFTEDGTAMTLAASLAALGEALMRESQSREMLSAGSRSRSSSGSANALGSLPLGRKSSRDTVLSSAGGGTRPLPSVSEDQLVTDGDAGDVGSETDERAMYPSSVATVQPRSSSGGAVSASTLTGQQSSAGNRHRTNSDVTHPYTRRSLDRLSPTPSPSSFLSQHPPRRSPSRRSGSIIDSAPGSEREKGVTRGTASSTDAVLGQTPPMSTLTTSPGSSSSSRSPDSRRATTSQLFSPSRLPTSLPRQTTGSPISPTPTVTPQSPLRQAHNPIDGAARSEASVMASASTSASASAPPSTSTTSTSTSERLDSPMTTLSPTSSNLTPHSSPSPRGQEGQANEGVGVDGTSGNGSGPGSGIGDGRESNSTPGQAEAEPKATSTSMSKSKSSSTSASTSNPSIWNPAFGLDGDGEGGDGAGADIDGVGDVEVDVEDDDDHRKGMTQSSRKGSGSGSRSGSGPGSGMGIGVGAKGKVKKMLHLN